jgi:hypothetical protein
MPFDLPVEQGKNRVMSWGTEEEDLSAWLLVPK